LQSGCKTFSMLAIWFQTHSDSEWISFRFRES
jgi:hypothetical protein